MTDFIEGVEQDVEAGVKAVETAAVDVGELAINAFKGIEQSLVNDFYGAIQKVLGGNINLNQDLTDLEGAVLMDLEHAGSALFGQAETIGSNLLQVLIGLALKALPLAL